MANVFTSSKRALLKDIDGLHAKIHQLETKISLITSWMHSKFGVLPSELQSILYSDGAYINPEEEKNTKTNFKIGSSRSPKESNSPADSSKEIVPLVKEEENSFDSDIKDEPEDHDSVDSLEGLIPDYPYCTTINERANVTDKDVGDYFDDSPLEQARGLTSKPLPSNNSTNKYDFTKTLIVSLHDIIKFKPSHNKSTSESELKSASKILFARPKKGKKVKLNCEPMAGANPIGEQTRNKEPLRRSRNASAVKPRRRITNEDTSLDIAPGGFSESAEIFPKNRKAPRNRKLNKEHLLQKCKDCKKSFSTESEYDEHSILCTGKRKAKKNIKQIGILACRICEESYITEGDFDDHLSRHVVQIIVCGHSGCKRQFINEEDVTEHERKIHCPKCFKSFPNLAHFNVHNNKQHNGQEIPNVASEDFDKRKLLSGYNCTSCEKICPNVGNFKDHLQTGCLQCNLCEKKFISSASWYSHVCSADERKRFLCTHCGKTFARNGQLTIHIKTHHKEREKMECLQCNKTFVSMVGYYSHMKTHHTGGVIRLQCNICGFDFAHATSLNKHIKAIHQNLRPYACHLCDKKFKTASARKYHFKTHDNPNGRKRGLNKDVDDIVAASKRRNLTK